MSQDKKFEEKTDQPIMTSFPKNKIEILLTEKVSQSAIDRFVKEGYHVEKILGLSEEQLIEKIKNVHVIGIRSKTKLPERVLKHARKLLCVGHFCIGTDQTNLEFAAQIGIPVFNSPFANTRSVAELVLAHSIVLARKAGDQNRWMHDGQWKKTAVGCFEVRGKTMGIVGYGHVGSQLSILAEALGFFVLFFDILPKLPLGNARSVDSLEKLLQLSDFVSLHVPYTKQTHNMIGSEQLKLMKKGSYLMNAARGKCVVIEDLAKFIETKHIAGAYIDVYPKEPTDETLILRNLPNVILTPHIGGATEEAQDGIGMDVCHKIIKFINGGVTVGAVNFPEITMSPNENVHRILHVHNNTPGVLVKINNILSSFNITSQTLKTTPKIGYLLVELESDKSLSSQIKKEMNSLNESIRTRLVFSPGFS